MSTIMTRQQRRPAPAPSSTAYSLAGFDLTHSVDDLTPTPSPSPASELEAANRRTSKERRKRRNSQQLFLSSGERVRRLEDVLASSDCDEEFEDDRSALGNLIRTLKKMASDASTPMHGTALIATVSEYLKVHNLEHDAAYQQPILASKLALKSQFITHGTDFFNHRAGVRSTDYRTWTDGFDATIFCKSARLQEGDEVTPFLVKYKLSGTEQKYKDNYSIPAIYGRSRAAFHQFLQHVNPILANEMWTADFPRLADYFFKGKALDESFEEYNRTATHSGDDRREGYTINPGYQSPWKKFVDEVSEAAELESETEGRYIPVFMNTAHKDFGMFMQDVIQANEMNAAMRTGTSYHSRVFPGQAYVEAIRILDNNKSITKEDVKRVSQLRDADAKDKSRVQHYLAGSQVLRITDITGIRDGDEDDELAKDADAHSKAVNAQLLADLHKSQPEKKSKSRKRKPKAKGPSAKAAPQAETTEQAESSKEAVSPEQAKPLGEVKNPVQDKNESSGLGEDRKQSERPIAKEPEILSGDITTPSRSATDNKKKSRGKANTVDKPTVSSKPVITLSDYEDAPATQSSTNDTEGWQTVKKPSKPKPTGVTAFRASSRGIPGAKRGIPGANSGPQRGTNPSIGSGQQINRQSGARPANQTAGLRPAARNTSSLAQNNANPAASNSTDPGTSSKPAVQIPALDQSYKNAFPPIEGEAAKQTTTTQTLKITPVVPKKSAKSSVVVKEKVVKKGSGDAIDNENSSREDGSDLKLASKKVTDDVSDKTDGISTPKRSSDTISDSKKTTSKASGNVLKTSTPKQNTAPNSASKIAEKKLIVPERDTQIAEPKDEIPHSTTEQTHVPQTASVSPEENAPSDLSSSEHEDLSQFQESFDDGPSSEEPSRLDENYPVTPQHPASSQQVHVKDITDTPTNVEERDPTPLKKVDDPLSWAGASLTTPLNFEGRPRGISLPGDAFHSLGIFSGAPPSIFQRARGQSLQSQLSEEDDDGSEASPSTVPEEASSPRADEPDEDSGSRADEREEDNISRAEESFTDATTSKKVIVVTVHLDNTFTVAPPVVDTSSQSSSSAPAMKYGLPAVVQTPASMDRSPLTQADCGVPRDHPHHPLNSIHGYMPGFTPAAPNGGDGPANAPLITPGVLRQSYSCTQCSVNIVPTIEHPMVFCPGCGPDSGTTYCCVECLLVDAYDHASDCWNMPAASRAYPHVFPPGCPYVYETHPVMPENMRDSTREKFRQRTFLMYARYGPWRNLAAAWCRKHVEWPVSTTQYPVTPESRKHHHDSLIDWETQKRTGSYFIFWSGSFDKEVRGNPNADVIYTVSIEQSDPQKGFLSRILYALMVREEGIRKPLVTFAYRMIRNILTTPALYNNGMGAWEDARLVLSEFERQFQTEFNFNGRMDRNANIPFDFNREIVTVLAELRSIEGSFSTLPYWNRDC